MKNKFLKILLLSILMLVFISPNLTQAQISPELKEQISQIEKKTVQPQEELTTTGAIKTAGSAVSGIFGQSFFDGLMSVAGKAIAYFVFVINYLIGFIAGIAFALGGVLLQLGLELNARIILSPVVRTGWVITRDIANLGFVIAIITIAFTTMLRVETYNTKKLLTNLIVVALLVNFSLTFAGVFIDATGIISNFFIQQVSPGNLGGVLRFAENLASIFQVQKLHEIKDLTELPEFGNLSEFSASMLGLLASIFFVALFTVIGAAVMLMIAGLVFVRYIALSILLVMMPLALVAFIFPNLKGRGKAWVKKFTEWLLFMPVTLFFLYLTMLMVTNFKSDPNSIVFLSKSVDAANAGAFTGFLLPIADSFQIFAQMIVILGMLIGGLIAAKSFSLEFSNGIIGYAEGVKDWAIGKAVERGGKIVNVPGRFTGRQVLDSKAARETARLLTRVPGLKGAGAALSTQIASSTKLSAEEVKKYREKYLKNLPEANDVRSFVRTFITPKVLTPVAQAAEVAELADRGKIDDALKNLKPDDKNNTITRWLKAAQLAGIENDILKVKPDWAPLIGRDISKTVGKIENVNKVSADSFGNADVVTSLLEEQLKKTTAEQKKMIKETMSTELDKMVKAHNISNQMLEDLEKFTKKELQALAKDQKKTIEEISRDRKQRAAANQYTSNMSDKDFSKLKALVNIKRESINPTWQT